MYFVCSSANYRPTILRRPYWPWIFFGSCRQQTNLKSPMSFLLLSSRMSLHKISAGNTWQLAVLPVPQHEPEQNGVGMRTQQTQHALDNAPRHRMIRKSR